MAGALPPLNHNIETASSLPPLNHAEEQAANLPPLLHGVEQAGNLPPLNHGKDALQSFNSLPPLNHGVEQAANLPPLNHGKDALQSFNSLPPLNHGVEQAANLPPLNHGIENNGLPPLNHGDDEAAMLPPLLHGIEQAKHTPSASFEKQSSENVDALSSFTSQVENAAPSSDNGKQTYPKFPLDLKGVGRGPLVMPKTYTTDAMIPPASQQAVKQPFTNSGNMNFIKNYNNMMEPVVQGKELTDQPFLNISNQSVGESVNRKGNPFSSWDENAQSKGVVPSVYDDSKELQNLFRADQMSQGIGTSTTAAKFGIPASSGIIVVSASVLPF